MRSYMQVHEDNNTVTVQAGVTQRILLDYLATYMCADPLPAHGLLRHLHTSLIYPCKLVLAL